MSFSWAETLTQYVTKVKLTHLTELRTNINTDRSNTGLSNYSWVVTPSVGDKVLQSEIAELRTAIDASYDNRNVCVTHNASYLTAQHASLYNCGGNYAYYNARLGSYNGPYYPCACNSI